VNSYGARRLFQVLREHGIDLPMTTQPATVPGHIAVTWVRLQVEEHAQLQQARYLAERKDVEELHAYVWRSLALKRATEAELRAMGVPW